MKRLKYMHSIQRAKKQKDHQSLPSKIEKNQHIESIKTQAVKTLYNIEQDYLGKTQLNITFRNNQISLKNKYKRRSLSQKQNLRKTTTSSLGHQRKNSYNSKLNNKQHKHEQPYNINIKQLLRIKTQSLHQQQHDRLLRNPFYKIQKVRQLNNNVLTSKKTNDNKKQRQVSKQINQQQLNQLQRKQLQQREKQFLVSRERKQWYFASKKYRLRTLQHDQPMSVVSVNNTTKNKTSQDTIIMSKTPQNFYKKYPSTHLLKTTTQQQSIDLNQSKNTVLQFDKMQSIMFEDQNPVIKQQSRQQSPARIRQKSLTVKYNQIKDYFQKKYHKKYSNQLDQSFINQFYGYDQ